MLLHGWIERDGNKFEVVQFKALVDIRRGDRLLLTRDEESRRVTSLSLLRGDKLAALHFSARVVAVDTPENMA